MKRKIISIILVAVMTISCSTVANAAEKNTVSVEKRPQVQEKQKELFGKNIKMTNNLI